MENEKYDVIIVGGGPNGLTAGAYLARAGARVLLIERRHETGGGLVSEDFSAFRFNLHAIYMLMMDVMPPYDDLDLYAEGCVYLQPEVQVSLLTRDGKALTLYRDLDHSVESIRKFSPKDAERFRDVYLESKELSFGAIIPLTYTLPVPTLDFADMLQKSDIGQKILEFSSSHLVKNNVAKSIQKLQETSTDIHYRFDLISDMNSTDDNLMLMTNNKIVKKLNLQWPDGLYSLSHLAVPISNIDPLYGDRNGPKSPGVQLGHLAFYGETSILEISAASMLRQRWNPFHDYTKQRVLEFMKLEE